MLEAEQHSLPIAGYTPAMRLLGLSNSGLGPMRPKRCQAAETLACLRQQHPVSKNAFACPVMTMQLLPHVHTCAGHSFRCWLMRLCMCRAGEGVQQRWAHITEAAQSLTHVPLPPAGLLARGNARMHLALLALVFSARPGETCTLLAR